MSTKLLVPAGGLAQSSSGETFSPLQPKLLNDCLSVSLPPSLKSVLVSLKGAADAVAPSSARSDAVRIVFFMRAVYASSVRCARVQARVAGVARGRLSSRGAARGGGGARDDRRADLGSA